MLRGEGGSSSTVARLRFIRLWPAIVGLSCARTLLSLAHALCVLRSIVHISMGARRPMPKGSVPYAPYNHVQHSFRLFVLTKHHVWLCIGLVQFVWRNTTHHKRPIQRQTAALPNDNAAIRN